METQRRVRGDTVRHVRELRGMSMQTVNKKGGPTPTTCSHVENSVHGDVRPSTLRKLAAALKVDPAIFYLSPSEAEDALLGPLGLGQPGDPTDQLLAVLQDAAAAYAPESGVELAWDAETYRGVMSKLTATAERAAALDFQTGRTDRGLSLMEALIEAVMGLGVRLDRLESRTNPSTKAPTAPPRPAPISAKLTDAQAMNEQLDKLAA